MSFGFSVGDFIAVGNLAIKTVAALKDSTGSKSDFQSLKLIRASLDATLVEAQLQIDSDHGFLPPSAVKAIKLHLNTCSQILRDFDKITRKFDVSLSSQGSGWMIMDFYRKLEWNTTRDGIRDLFGNLQQHIQAIQTLWSACHT